MEEILRIKFSNIDLAEKLKNVKEPIVEDNTWHDTFWGVCDGQGKNMLGKLLEKIKKDLQTQEKRIVVLGGSFNPPTKAHIELLDTAIKQTNAEFGIFVPSSDNYVKRKMSKQKSNNKAYSQQTRLKMLNEICKENKKFVVDTCEYDDDGRGHTYDTLCKIQEKYPDYKIMFVIGADKLKIVPKWHNSKEFFEKFHFVVTKRENIDINNIIKNTPALVNYKDIFHEITVTNDIFDISSSVARKAINEKDYEMLKKILHATTLKFI
jgi:nicotinate (nicotinamide) nucleotide adenylyltransferase